MKRFAAVILVLLLQCIAGCAHNTTIAGVEGKDYRYDDDDWRCYSPRFERQIMQIKIDNKYK